MRAESLSARRFWQACRKSLGVALFAAVLAFLMVHYFAILAAAENRVADIRTATFLKSQPPSRSIAIVAVTEDTLKRFLYRSPMDRQFLATLLTQVSAAGARAIFLDFLLDQPSEPEKDEALRRAIRDIPTPLVIAYTDRSDIVDGAQRRFIDGFVPPAFRGVAELGSDAEGVVRNAQFGRLATDGSYVGGIGPALLGKLGIKIDRDPGEIAWRGRRNSTIEPFAIVPAEVAAAMSPGQAAAAFKDRIVLIGAILSLSDRHRTPFSSVYEGDRGNLPGIVIQAHAIDQMLTGRVSPRVSWPFVALLIFATALFGAILALSDIALWLRGLLGFAFVIALWVAGFGLLLLGLMIPLVGPTLALVLAMWAGEAVAREALRQRLPRVAP